MTDTFLTFQVRNVETAPVDDFSVPFASLDVAERHILTEEIKTYK